MDRKNMPTAEALPGKVDQSRAHDLLPRRRSDLAQEAKGGLDVIKGDNERIVVLVDFAEHYQLLHFMKRSDKLLALVLVDRRVACLCRGRCHCPVSQKEPAPPHLRGDA